GAVLRDTRLKDSEEAFICKLYFIDAANEIVTGDYEGALHSEDDGNYVYIPSLKTDYGLSWSTQTITVPPGSHRVVLNIYVNEPAMGGAVDYIHCIEQSKFPMSEGLYE